MRPSEIRIHSAGIENARRIELRFQASMNGRERRRERCEHAFGSIATTKQRRVAASLGRNFTHLLGALVCAEPAQGSAPFDELRTLHRLSLGVT